MKITLKMLRLKGACSDQVDLFKAEFGEEVEVTRELCEKYARRFDFDWAACNLLSAPARAKFEKVRAPARAKFEKVRAVAFYDAASKEATDA